MTGNGVLLHAMKRVRDDTSLSAPTTFLFSFTGSLPPPTARKRTMSTTAATHIPHGPVRPLASPLAHALTEPPRSQMMRPGTLALAGAAATLLQCTFNGRDASPAAQHRRRLSHNTLRRTRCPLYVRERG
jgi:hypothetical protein